MLRRLRHWIPVTFAVLLSAFTRPQVGDLVELRGFVNAHMNAKFRQIDENRVYVLQAGTKAQVEQVQYFPATGNYGIRIKLINAAGVRSQYNNSLWVYYNVQNPAMKLYSAGEDPNALRRTLERWQSDPAVRALEVRNPRQATAAVVTRETQAIPAPHVSPPPSPSASAAAPARGSRGQGEVAPAEVVQSVESLNRAARRADPEPRCRECSERPPQYGRCTAQNSYLEDQIDRLQSGVLSTLLNTTPRYPRLEACVRESMNISGGPFALCRLGEDQIGAWVGKACTSERLVKIVQNAFTLSVDCMATYINGAADDPAVLRETFRSTLALVNLESGFHTNAVSSTGAGGLGQITSGAIDWVNRHMWSEMQNHIRNSSNPSCRQLQGVNMRPISSRSRASCDRMSLEDGNPLTNMFYTLGHIKMVRKDVETTLNRKLRESRLQLDPAFREKLVGALANWGHNTGAYGLTRPLSALLETDAGVAALRSGNLEQFLGLLKAEVRSFHVYYLRRQGASEQRISARAHEASQFHDVVQKKMGLLERKVGRSCGL
jgi:hypothetical protein